MSWCFSCVKLFFYITFIYIFKVFLDWNDLSLVIRSKVFEKDEMEQIDIHDVKVLLILLLHSSNKYGFC